MDNMKSYGDEFVAAVAAELRAERAASELTYAELVSATGMHETTIIRYLKGGRDIPMSALAKLCGALGVSPAVILDNAVTRIKRSKKS